MNSFTYEAVNSAGLRVVGALDVADQSEALRRLREMGLFPTRVVGQRSRRRTVLGSRPLARSAAINLRIPGLSGRVKPRALTVFTRQLATLIDAGMPLLRGLKILEEQETNAALKHVVGGLSDAIESGGSLSEAMAMHPRVFNTLYLNMVRAGEISGALEITLKRLAEFQEKAQRIKGKVKAAMFYPVAVMLVAAAIMGVMMVFVIPRFKEVFSGLLNGASLPAFTSFVFQVSDLVRHRAPLGLGILAALVISLVMFGRTAIGRYTFDRLKLVLPAVGRVFRQAAISRFARTLGTLLANGVPVLQALNIVRDTAGNVVIGRVVETIHTSVKEGESLTAPLRATKIFPPMIAGMVDVGEQTGALPEMLLKIADNCDEEVDNAVSAMTSLLEPVLIVFLAVVVGSIVIALFLPIIVIGGGIDGNQGVSGDN
jgi:type IV pilus assembly protein PilC